MRGSSTAFIQGPIAQRISLCSAKRSDLGQKKSSAEILCRCFAARRKR